jgi:periplasmic protein TonB
MFETVAPETFAPRSRKVWYETLPLSIALHGLVIAAFILGSLWQVEFPDQSPRLMALYSLTSAPTPPPPPPPPPAPRKVVTQVQVVQVKLPENTAPTVIPDVIPEVLPQQPEVADVGPVPEGVEGGVEGGIEGGVVGGVLGGTEGGIVGGTVGSVAVADVAPPDTVIVKRDAPLPMAPLSQTYPRYPEEARIRGHEDVLLVKYIIGKNGRVREVIVLQRPERAIFEEITVKAIKHWRFKPYKVDGVPQEVIHELTVYFKLNA